MAENVGGSEKKCNFAGESTKMNDMEITKKTTRAENIAINSKKTPRSRRMRYAREHKGELVVVDPGLRAQLISCAPL